MLARRSKIELMKDYHLTTSRDFRIRTDVIHVTMNEQEADKVGANFYFCYYNLDVMVVR